MPLTKATSNVIAPITATGTSTSRAIQDRFADVINVKDFGATGNGTTDDTAAIQAAITAAPTGAAIYFPKGSYKAYLVQVTKDITIFGDGMDVTEFVFGQEYGAKGFNGTFILQSAYFILHGGVEFNIRNVTMVDKFGLRPTGKFIPQPHPPNTGWPIQPMGICSITRDSLVPTDFPNLINVQNVKFLDLYLPIQSNAKKLIAYNNEFLWTYGKAGVGMPLYQLGVGPQPGGGNGPWTIIGGGDPHAAIMGSFGTALIKNNYFNGLIDETFSNANAGYLDFRAAADNFIENYQRQQFVNAWMTNENGTHDYSNNTIVNHGVEGIHFVTGNTVSEFPRRSSLNITNNFIKPLQNNYINYAQTVNPCIAIAGRLPATKISGNIIENTYCGIAVAYDVVPVIYPLNGNIEISNNVLTGVVIGIDVLKISEKDIISNNTIFCQSRPNKLSLAFLNSQGIYPQQTYSNLIGIYVSNCNPIVTNNTLSAEYEFELTTTLVSQASNVLTLANATGIVTSDGGWGILIKYQGKSRFFPVTNVNGNNITVDPNYVGGTVFPNGITVYWTRRFIPNTGAITVNNQGSQVTNLNQVFYNTIMNGFLNDISANDLTGSNGSATLVNTTAININQKTSDVYPQPQFFREDGFYYKN